MRFKLILIIPITTVLATCNISDRSKETGNTAVTKKDVPNICMCDSFQIDKPKIKDYKEAFKGLFEPNSPDWFLENNQSIWREAKAWHTSTFLVDSNPIIKCLSNNLKTVFLYIPNHFYSQKKNGNEYFRFYIVNNSSDTVQIPRLDNVVNNISSSISTGDSLKWLSFQYTDKIIDCGNSIWTMKLPPKMATLSEIESDRVNLGDTVVDYRLELTLGKQKIVSNSIKIYLLKKQLRYLDKQSD